VTLPGFTAEVAVRNSINDYRSAMIASARATRTNEIHPAAVLVYTGHCGCYADDWFGLPCLCIETGWHTTGET
jgi:hypothetical protein